MSEPRRRVALALAIPLLALAGGGVVVWAVSRILLASDVNVAPIAGLLIAVNVLIAAGLATTLQRRRAATILIVALSFPLVAAGVVSAIAGERPIHSRVAEEGHEEEPEPHETPGQDEEPSGEPSPTPGASPSGEGGGEADVTIVSRAIAFDLNQFSLPAEQEVTIRFMNEDEAIPHNVSIYTEAGGESLFQGEVFPGVATLDYTFTSPPAGEYYFQCDLHANMNGTVTVQ